MNSQSELLRLDSVSIRPSNQFLAIKKKAAPFPLEASIPEIKFTHPNLMLLLQKELKAEEMHISQSRFRIYDLKKIEQRKPNSPFEFLSKIPLDIHIKTVKLQQASIAFSNQKINGQATGDLELYECNINLKPVNKGDLPFHDASFTLRRIHISSTLYTVTIGRLARPGQKTDLFIDQLKVIPRYSKFEFSRKLGYQADRVEGNLSTLRIQNPDLPELFHKKLIADGIFLSGCHASIFRDRRLPLLPKTRLLPVAFLKNLPFEIRVKTLQLKNSSLTYEEQPRDDNQTGILHIERVQASLSPVVNHPVKGDPGRMILTTEGSLMGSGLVYATIYLPLRSKDYFVKGAFRNLDLTKLNSSSENLGKIRIRSGLLDSLGFQFSFNNRQSDGKIVGEYHHLIIQQLKKKGTEEKKVAWFRSFMLRHLIIPLNKDKTLPERRRTGKINFQHDPTRYLSYNLMHALLTGIKSSFTLGFLLPK
jgi:hypothetical protein